MNYSAADFFQFFTDLKLELLMQIPSLNDEKYVHLLKHNCYSLIYYGLHHFKS